MEKVLLLITLVLTANTSFAQKALKILKNDGSITYINASAVNKITFEAPLAIGDTLAGGIIFYLDASGEHGLVAATSNQSNGIQWYNGSYTTTGATRDTVGAGKENTDMIVGNQGTGSYAAKLCSDLTLGGYTDWYLPSKYELTLMYNNLKLNGFGDFSPGYYSSSTEFGDFVAWAKTFNDGTVNMWQKNNSTMVRAVRAF